MLQLSNGNKGIKMRIRKKAWVEKELNECDFFIKNPKELKGKWSKCYKRVQPMHLELGCGKGNFIATLSKNHPEFNYLAIDLIDDMLGLAKRNIEKVFQSEREIDNVLLTAWNIEQLLEIFDGEKFERIYINFCNPWPRPRHNKRRLTYPKQLELYKKILISKGEIYFKTDDDELYNATLKYFETSGFEVIKKTVDLHNNPIFKENIVTEHEKMFTEDGIKIKAIIAKFIDKDSN